jgi:hypothetical protein
VIAFAVASFHVSQLIEECKGIRKRRKNFFKILGFSSIDTKGEPRYIKAASWAMADAQRLCPRLL